MDSDVHGYALTGNPAFAQSYDLAAHQLPFEFGKLKTLVRDNPPQDAAIDLIAGKIEIWSYWQTENIHLIRRGARNEAVARIATLFGKEKLDDLCQNIAAFQLGAEQVHNQWQGHLERMRASFQWEILVGTGVSLLSAAVLLIVFNRGVSRRLKTVIENARRIAEGKELIRLVAGRDEIASLDQSFRGIAQTLTHSRENLADEHLQRRLILDAVSEVAIIATNLQGGIMTFSLGAEKMLGYAAEELIDRQTAAVFHYAEEMICAVKN